VHDTVFITKCAAVNKRLIAAISLGLVFSGKKYIKHFIPKFIILIMIVGKEVKERSSMCTDWEGFVAEATPLGILGKRTQHWVKVSP
jgi:hypothetical protein